MPTSNTEIFSANMHSVSRFIQDAIYNHRTHVQKCAPHHHARKACLHNNNTMVLVLDLIAVVSWAGAQNWLPALLASRCRYPTWSILTGYVSQ